MSTEKSKDAYIEDKGYKEGGGKKPRKNADVTSSERGRRGKPCVRRIKKHTTYYMGDMIGARSAGAAQSSVNLRAGENGGTGEAQLAHPKHLWSYLGTGSTLKVTF